MLFTLVQYFSLENELQSYTYITLVVVTHERHIAERAEKIIHLLDGTVQQVEELKTFSKI
jgi:ABC-type lipoprotein export system ATPase subunit